MHIPILSGEAPVLHAVDRPHHILWITTDISNRMRVGGTRKSEVGIQGRKVWMYRAPRGRRTLDCGNDELRRNQGNVGSAFIGIKRRKSGGRLLEAAGVVTVHKAEIERTAPSLRQGHRGNKKVDGPGSQAKLFMGILLCSQIGSGRVAIYRGWQIEQRRRLCGTELDNANSQENQLKGSLE
ncbi:MAG: hypothetical protein BGO25_08210 [Acidobacteriales bacterium 59-55]|nr:MAG: hypothetical protein BGO25_08210 [Acidobacteriales bacterium 59-55]